MKVEISTDYFKFSMEAPDNLGFEIMERVLKQVFPISISTTTTEKPPVDPAPHVDVIEAPVKKKRAYVRHKTLNFTKERDKIIRDNFEKLGHGGIFDKSLLPGFSLAEIRQRCIELRLLDKYGNRPYGGKNDVAETA